MNLTDLSALEAYKKTPTFTQETIPSGLTKDHATKEGTWGLIHVLEGELIYRVTDQRRDPSERVLMPGSEPGLVEPTILHQVKPIGPVRFYVQFLRETEYSESGPTVEGPKK